MLFVSTKFRSIDESVGKPAINCEEIEYNDASRLAKLAKKEGYDIHKCENSWMVPATFQGVGGIVYCADSTTFCTFVSNFMNWNIYQNSPEWVSKLPTCFLKRKVELIEKIRDLEAQFPRQKDKFIQCLDADVFTPVKVMAGTKPNFGFSHYQAMISDYVNFDVEYVFLIKDGWVNDFALDKGREIDNDDPVEFVEKLLDTVKTAPSFVLRVGYIKSRGWAVISSKPIWASPIYGLDTSKFWDALKLSCK